MPPVTPRVSPIITAVGAGEVEGVETQVARTGGFQAVAALGQAVRGPRSMHSSMTACWAPVQVPDCTHRSGR